ncbi:MAG: DJ-1/PfpI family protein [Opitutales bacterium]|nr:DJ-1/PfpI family protein [Opitutales bacterium]MCH8539821.1 DJ-1/PfpI family protein [Opitutales bacterium]
MSKKALIVLAEDFEEIEALAPLDILRRAGIKCTLAAQLENKFVIGKTGLQVVANRLLSQCYEQDYDLLLLPGGPGVRHLCEDEDLRKMILRQIEGDRWLAAICAAPLVLAKAGLIPEPYNRLTGHFSIRDKMPCPLLPEPVVQCGNLTTSCGAGTAIPFALQLVENLLGPEVRQEVAEAIMYKDD